MSTQANAQQRLVSVPRFGMLVARGLGLWRQDGFVFGRHVVTAGRVIVAGLGGMILYRRFMRILGRTMLFRLGR